MCGLTITLLIDSDTTIQIWFFIFFSKYWLVHKNTWHLTVLGKGHSKCTHTNYTQAFYLVMSFFPSKAQEGVDQQHSWHTLELWVVDVLTDPSHLKFTAYELWFTHLSYTDRRKVKQEPKVIFFLWMSEFILLSFISLSCGGGRSVMLYLPPRVVAFY